MKYKEQALNKIEKLESQIRLLEMTINRNMPLDRINAIITNIKEIVEQLRSNISIEHDEWN